MAKDIFLGALGALIGATLMAMIGSRADPEANGAPGWLFLIIFAAVIGARGMIWLGQVL